MFKRFSMLALLMALGLCAFLARAAQPAEPIVHMLDYMSVDYAGAVADGKVIDAGEYTEMQDFSAQIIAQLKALDARPQQPALITEAEKLAQSVNAKAAVEQVARQANDLRRQLVAAYDLVVAPKRAPDLSGAGAQYQSLCATCHGAEGRGDGIASAGMDPAPANFRDVERMRQRSVYGLYNTITLGVNGTAMAAYARLSEEERWALAFYVARYANDTAEVSVGARAWQEARGREVFSGLREVATLDYNEAKQRGGEEAAAIYAYLIANPDLAQAAQGSPIATSKALLKQSADAYVRGERDLAQRLAVSSYLEGFELVEAGLDTLDGKLRVEVENEMIRLRTAMRDSAANEIVLAQVKKVDAL
ncbi:MAG TPA: cytochrome c, partial [Burkholderiales bacterium]|nr:cytochrome c [Burkholderiales bacterium]